MPVTYKHVRGRIQAIWPNCRNIWLRDPEYVYPDESELKYVLGVDHTERLKMRGYQFDCDDYALQLSAAVSKVHGQDVNSKYPWPFGQVMGRRFLHIQENHTCNICVLSTKIVIVEPQTDMVREVDQNWDDPYFIIIP